MFKGEGSVSKCLWCSQSIIVAFYKYLFNSNVNICILLCAYMMRLSRPHPRQKWSPQIRQLLVTHLPMFMALLYNLDDIHTINANKYEVSTYNTFCAVNLWSWHIILRPLLQGRKLSVLIATASRRQLFIHTTICIATALLCDLSV